MSAKADKGDRKRETEQSPMKKKFRDSAISREDLDEAIANRIELAFKEQQSTLNSVVKVKVKVGLFVTYTIIQSTISSEMQGFFEEKYSIT